MRRPRARRALGRFLDRPPLDVRASPHPVPGIPEARTAPPAPHHDAGPARLRWGRGRAHQGGDTGAAATAWPGRARKVKKRLIRLPRPEPTNPSFARSVGKTFSGYRGSTISLFRLLRPQPRCFALGSGHGHLLGAYHTCPQRGVQGNRGAAEGKPTDRVISALLHRFTMSWRRHFSACVANHTKSRQRHRRRKVLASRAPGPHC